MGSGGFVSSYEPNQSSIDKLKGIAREELSKPAEQPRRRVFVSFRYEDKTEMDLLRGQAKNKNSELDFIDMGLKVPFNSKDAEYIKEGIRARIAQSSVTLVGLSETTHQSEWVDWEIRETIRQGKGVVMVNISKNPSVKIPDAATEGKGRIKIVAWDHEEIMQAIKEVA